MPQGKDDMIFSVVPHFARFVLVSHLDDFIRKEIQFSRALQIPLWEQFRDLSEEDIITQSLEFYKEFLEAIAENKCRENLNNSIVKYRLDLLMHVKRAEITPEDLLLGHASRKKALLYFLERYTSDPKLIIDIVQEINSIFTEYDVAAADAYIELLAEKVDEECSIKEKLFNTSPGFYYIYDIMKDIQVLPSDKLFKALGYNCNEYAGNNQFFRQLMHPEDIANSVAYFSSLKNIMEGEVRFFEYRLRSANGEYRWLRNYESVYKWTNEGEPHQLLGVAFDISQERFFAAEIMSKEEALSEAQTLAHMGAFTWDIQRNTVSGFSRSLSSLGLVQGNSFEEVLSNVHPTDKPQVIKIFNKAIQGKRAYECEYRCIADNRERILWSKGKVTYIDGVPRFLKATIMDVTDQHHMVRKLQRSEELYKQAQSLNKIGNWSWNFNSDRIQWSDELFKIFGLTPQSEQITYERYFSFLHPEDCKSRNEIIQDQIKNPGHREYYFRIITADGKEKILYGQSEVLTDEYNVPYKMIGTCQDVTEQKTLETKLFDRTVQLQKSNASLKVFAYISSHDLKEPLRKISLFGDRLRLLNEKKFDEQSNGILNTIIQSSLRLQQMIDEILSVSRINADEHFEQNSLQSILEDVLLNMETQIQEKGAVINYDALPVAFVNPIQIAQLFSNLISNALKFSRPQVIPTIMISSDSPSIKEINEAGLDNSKQYTRLTFTDNGIGFQEQYAEKIFAIFQRLHDKSAYKGTGIGLAICREIAGHHGGTISARGILHQGAIFTVILPLGIH
ncbi:MAG TPA: PAS domain-containing protein [Flavitalea sp.]|nr:PAS domain-containing protein [Flavitalea sp.]